MRSAILILGQGLAGTLLGWELQWAGVDFTLVDAGPAGAATSAAAGLINPVTGRRLVKSWRIDALLPAARATYGAIETELGVALWHDVRIRRLFADERERSFWRGKQARGELAPFAGVGDADGFWIEPAARIDLPRLLAASRTRWRSEGRLHEAAWSEDDVERALAIHPGVIDCRGVAAAASGRFERVPWEYVQGEMLELAVAGLPVREVLNRRQWLVPVAEGAAWVGATQVPGERRAVTTPGARVTLEASARGLLGLDRSFVVTGQRAGVRVALPDRRPAAGRHPERRGLGVCSGLGGKGALWAPLLARQWARHLTTGEAFDKEVDVSRFWARDERR